DHRGHPQAMCEEGPRAPERVRRIFRRARQRARPVAIVDTLLKIRYLQDCIQAMPLKRPEVAMAQREADEYDALEQQYAQGISAAQIVEFFAPRGVKLAQATFRKYVQLGLLPRSRRVGEKGKHRGSHGL